ncbi:glutamine synthetase family protein [Falsiroseomonas tokyonensis]|uniref:Glutamine synthetase family protein n=1 Tax=Falsiroseomonas tokyonensis TaxID=430521 RepID=A0ABV7BUT5_9PROT|nr:glutamine synthetase family protein [Falsiroseomonas tokyonensis]MBU8539380.1 glutamine synthetase [Falsiroseomonas tokyonensis]
MSFVQRHGLDQPGLRAEVLKQIEAAGLGVLRLAFPDQHGILRGKTIMASEATGALANGVAMTTTLLLKDSSHRTVFPVWSAGGALGEKAMEGAADALLVPDPATFRTLPWAPHTGWILCDAYFADGRPVPLGTRHLLRQQVLRAGELGFEFCTGLEVEFHLFRLTDPKLAPGDAGQPGTPPEVALLTQGYNYLTELRYDQLDPILEILRREIQALGLPLRSMEVEYGPSQVEFTFGPQKGLASADAMVLFRSAVKQVARRHGYHATFMCRPRIPNVMSSGWHLHQSLVRDGRNIFAGEGTLLSETARHFLGGLLSHARAAAVFATPTINGYRRYRSHSLAPDRAIWGIDNRGVMVRALGAPGDAATRLENRVGEPAANPYLYLASQLAYGLEGIVAQRDPGPPADTPYETEAPLLPRSLAEAVTALEESATARAAFGDIFVDYYARLKRAEIARFEAEVSDWEHREYFELF